MEDNTGLLMRLNRKQGVPTNMTPITIYPRKECLKKYTMLNTLGIPFERFNPMDHDVDAFDCIIRTFCKVLGTNNWREVYKGLSDVGYNRGFGMNSIYVIREYADKNGLVTAEFSDEIPVTSFLLNHKTGRFAVSSSGHMFAYVNGTIYDTTHCLNFDDSIMGEAISFIIYDPKEVDYSDLLGGIIH